MMNTYKVTVVATDGEVVRYMLRAVDEKFAAATASIRYHKAYSGKIKNIDVIPA